MTYQYLYHEVCIFAMKQPMETQRFYMRAYPPRIFVKYEIWRARFHQNHDNRRS